MKLEPGRQRHGGTAMKKLSVLARLARKHPTKKSLQTVLRGEDLKEAWRIKQIQNERTLNRQCVIGHCSYGPLDGMLTPRKRSNYEREGLTRLWKKQALIWPMANHVFSYDFAQGVADKIKSGWKYTYQDKKYSLTLRHSLKFPEMSGSRSASSYDTFYLTLQFDLLRSEAVWIGGLLTIRLKSDAEKQTYPCVWLERKKDSPMLDLVSGQIIEGNYHQESGVRSLRKNLKRRDNPNPPKGWVTRAASIGKGNCPAGTDSFIQNMIIPSLTKLGYSVGEMAGAAIRKSFLLEIERNVFSTRL